MKTYFKIIMQKEYISFQITYLKITKDSKSVFSKDVKREFREKVRSELSPTTAVSCGPCH